MFPWSVHALLVLYAVLRLGMVNGTDRNSFLIHDADDGRRPILDQLVALVEKVNKQEDRLQTMETELAKHTVALIEKDRRIGHLEQEVRELKLKSVSGLIDITTRDITEDGLEVNQRGIYQRIADQNRRNATEQNESKYEKPGHNQRVHISDIYDTLKNGTSQTASEKSKPEVTFDRRRKPEAFQHDRTTEIVHSVKHQSKRVDNTSPSGYAFSVSLNANTNLVLREVVKYDHVLLDTGNGYNHGNGIYEVPASGVYVFTWSTTSDANNGGYLSTELMVNGVYRSATIADSDTQDWESVTGTIVTSVNTGDHVYIRSRSTGLVVSEVRGRSTFSGWRLF